VGVMKQYKLYINQCQRCGEVNTSDREHCRKCGSIL